MPEKKKRIRKPAKKTLFMKKGKTGAVVVPSFSKKPIDTAAMLLSHHKLPLFSVPNTKEKPSSTGKSKFFTWKTIAFLGILASLCEVPNITAQNNQNPPVATLPLNRGLFSVIATLTMVLSVLKLAAFGIHTQKESLKKQQEKKKSAWEEHIKNLGKHKNLYQELSQKELDHFFGQLDISALLPTHQQDLFNFIVKTSKEHPFLAKTVRELNSLLRVSYLKPKFISNSTGSYSAYYVGKFSWAGANGVPDLKIDSKHLLSDSFFHELKHAIQAQNKGVNLTQPQHLSAVLLLNEAQCKGYSLLTDNLYPYNKLLREIYLQEKQKDSAKNSRRILGRAENKTVGLIMNMLIAADFEKFIATEPIIKRAQLSEAEKNFLRLDVREWRIGYAYDNLFENTQLPSRSTIRQLSAFFTIDTGYKINVAELWKPKKAIQPPHTTAVLESDDSAIGKLARAKSKMLFAHQR